MAIIKQISISNFRSIKNIIWSPDPGMNCIIGPGDSGKSTIIEAIDLTLGARRSYAFTDADFFKMDVSEPIVIDVTIGRLDDQLKNIDRYGEFLRGFDNDNAVVNDEPGQGLETVLTVRLQVERDLDPLWTLYSERANESGIERGLSWKNRERIAPLKLGSSSHQHLTLADRSILSKLSDVGQDVSALLASVLREARSNFGVHDQVEIQQLITQVSAIASRMGVSAEGLKTMLDVKSASFSAGVVSLHDQYDTPLRQMGVGSTRLLIAGLMMASRDSSILLGDEIEYGLEPYRLTSLLHELGSKSSEPTKQVFITTHSPFVLRELASGQLHVLRPMPFDAGHQLISHRVAPESAQATLRANAEAFFSKAVIVCEGRTEVGLIRGLDLHARDTGKPTLHAFGIQCADGNGDSMFQRAITFASYGYETLIVKDSDKNEQHQEHIAQSKEACVSLVEWGYGFATEEVLFLAAPIDCIISMLDLAVEFSSPDSVNQSIENISQGAYNLELCRSHFQDDMRVQLGKAAKKAGWFKDIEKSERLAREILAPNFNEFGPQFTNVIRDLYQWVQSLGNAS